MIIKKNAIIAPNHVSFLDGPLISTSYPRPMFFFARKILFEKVLLGACLKKMHTFPISEGKEGVKALEVASKLLEKDRLIVFFPEGRRSRDGSLLPLQKGVAKLSLKNNSPIIPVWIEGAYESWSRHLKFPKLFKKITCVYGKPIEPNEYSDLPFEEAVEEILVELSKRYAELKKAADE